MPNRPSDGPDRPRKGRGHNRKHWLLRTAFALAAAALHMGPIVAVQASDQPICIHVDL